MLLTALSVATEIIEGPIKFGNWLKQSRAIVLYHCLIPLILYALLFSSMSTNSMASTSSYYSSSSSLNFPRDHDKIDLISIKTLVSLINKHIDEFLVDTKTWESLKQKCTSKLKTRKQEFFEFSEQSIISNLYWGIESVESAIHAKSAEEKITKLKNAERMLQVPALLNEHGFTAEIPNNYLVCCSYFYLSLVRKLQRDEWQVAIHFLQAIMVSPILVHKEFAPMLCMNIHVSCIASERQELNARRKSGIVNFEEAEISEELKWIARRYKGWLMYYQVMSYGDAPHGRRLAASPAASAEESKAYPYIPQLQDQKKALANLDKFIAVLVEVICTSNNHKCGLKAPKLTPPAASLMIIEVLVTAFDYATNNMHLEAISSPRVLYGLLNAPKQDNLEEFISLAAILVRCMRFDGQCRKQIFQFGPVGPFISLLLSNQKAAIFAGLEFLHEILHMPRSAAISLLQQIEEGGRINDIRELMLNIMQSQPEYKLLAANLLLQFDTLEDSSGTVIYREEAMEVLLESLTCEENPATQKISAFILSNLGGTYAWTGEPYTIAWLVKKAGLISLHHKNMIRSVDWSDESLQDAGTDTWSSKIARRIIKFGNPVFEALEKGLKSRTKRVARECLTTIAWLGYEIVKSQNNLRYSACEILLGTIEQYVHPGLELEERLLACLCIYNYASGRAMQKLVHFSEGVRESLRRLSSITWMAEEVLQVADYFQPNKWRISCIHTQFLEVGEKCSGAVNALIYYKGELYGGYADGSIKVWDVKGQSATLVRHIKEHRKAVTCFSLFEPQNCLLTGSADKTIRIWRMVDRKLECIEIIATKEPIQSLDTSGNMIFAVAQNNKMKVFDASKKAKDLYKKKNVKCIHVKEGKVYLGCLDSSIQEVAITNNRQQEMKASSWSWRMQRKTINSIALYKDWLYSASSIVEGSPVKEWRRHGKPQMSIVPEKTTTVVAMRVIEDFIYLQCTSSMNSLQIWLRGTQQHKVGRLSAGSKITSILTANDMVLCGTETGLIKGWIPL